MKNKIMRVASFIQKITNIASHKINNINKIKVAGSCNHLIISGLILTIIVSLSSCKGGFTRTDESPTRGDIRIISDESFQPLIDTEIDTFTSLYTNAKIKPLYKPEYDVINDFMNDSVKVIVTSKKLTEDQIQYLRDSLIIARTISFAWDALVLVTNKENHDTLIKYEDIRNIFLGNLKRWNELDSSSDLGDIRVIFDNTKSGNIRYFKELFEIETSLPDNFFAVNNNPEVIDFVSRNKDALGIVSVSWISDVDDSLSRSFDDKVNIVGVSPRFYYDGTYYRPSPGSIYTKDYPFVREIYFISRETFNGLGSGLIQWATAEQGQTIVLKSGLVPATMPIRLVQIKTE